MILCGQSNLGCVLFFIVIGNYPKGHSELELAMIYYIAQDSVDRK